MSPLDDLTYDVITVLQNKAKALEAYDKYLSDADADDDDELRDLFNSMRRQDEENVQVLKEVLAQRLVEDLGYDEEEDEEGEDYDEEEDEAEVEPVAEREVEDPASAGGEQGVEGVHGAVTRGADASARRGESSFRQR